MIRGTNPSVEGLFARAQAGDEDAWRELFEACYPKLRRAIRRKLTSPTMRSVYDSTDFAGDAWKSLVAKADRFDFPTIGHLMAFLTQVAQRKLIDANRRQHTLKNDTDRDRPIMVGGDHNGLREPSSNAPPISQVAVAREILDRLRSGLGEPGRTIIELKWRGYSNEEVAIRIGWHLRKVQRFLKDLHDSRLRPAPGEEAEHRDLEEAIAALDAVHEPVPGAEPGGPISGATSI